LYNNSQNEIFWNCIGTWNTSSFAGALMIRPVIGKPIPLGIGDLTNRDIKMAVYPNPCRTGTLHINLPESNINTGDLENSTLVITDLMGQVRLKSSYRAAIEVSSLPNGLYLIETRNRSGIRIGVSKFIIAK
jgi:hypothetical protein